MLVTGQAYSLVRALAKRMKFQDICYPLITEPCNLTRRASRIVIVIYNLLSAPFI